jgi:hypothetical protein
VQDEKVLVKKWLHLLLVMAAIRHIATLRQARGASRAPAGRRPFSQPAATIPALAASGRVIQIRLVARRPAPPGAGRRCSDRCPQMMMREKQRSNIRGFLRFVTICRQATLTQMPDL